MLHRFLAENTVAVQAPKGPTEVLMEILTQRLYSPGPARAWNHLISSKPLINICHRNHTWELATTAFSVSQALHGSWILQVNSLDRMAKSHSSKV